MGFIRQISLAGIAVTTILVTVPRPASAASQVTLVPFHATISEVVLKQEPCPPPQGGFLCVYLTGIGQATHLGRVTEDARPVVVVDPATGCITEVRTSTLTAQNGDQITLQGPGHACGATWSDSWVVIGGTGRFAGVTGYGTDRVTADFTTDPVTSVTTFSGMISLPGSNR